jgi:hypothetical protein
MAIGSATSSAVSIIFLGGAGPVVFQTCELIKQNPHNQPEIARQSKTRFATDAEELSQSSENQLASSK